MSKILTNEELNEIKIGMALVFNKDVSYPLRDEKLHIIANILELDYDDIEIGEDGAIYGEAYDWVCDIHGFIQTNRNHKVKEAILTELILLEAYLEIVELGLNKIKLKKEEK